MEWSLIPAFFPPLLAAVIAGGLIGFEREWRGRAAGFRTHILVCLASALLMELAVMQGQWRFLALPDTSIVADPARMAHGVLTGIGLVCAGAIFRSGFSIHGLTTAASLWITTAIGLVFGAGLYSVAWVATAITLAVLVALRLVSRQLPESVVVDAWVEWRRDAAAAEEDIEAALADTRRAPSADRFELIEDGQRIKRSFRLNKVRSEDLKALSSRLRAIDGVTGYLLDPRDD